MQDKIWRIQMLGGFFMHYGENPVMLNKAGTSKTAHLLQMLILSRRGGISKQELISHVYGPEEKADSANGNKNLNNLLYRLKGQLTACGLPREEYVELAGGICRLKCGIPMEVDVQEFEECVREAEGMPEGPERTALFQKANTLYQGELLPQNQTEAWFFQKGNYYKDLYIRTVRELEKEYEKRHDYQSLMQLYARASAIYPFDNWQTSLIRCNLRVFHYKEALDIYNHTLELYAEQMGMPPTEEMQDCFEQIKLEEDTYRKTFRHKSGKKNDLQAALFEETQAQGAYYCTYPSFVDYCHLVVRTKARRAYEAVVMFLTLGQNQKIDSKKQIDYQKQMGILKEAIGGALRIADAYTRYGNRHYILMLIEARPEDCSLIFRRIEKAYLQKGGKGELLYYADMTQGLEQAIRTI